MSVVLSVIGTVLLILLSILCVAVLLLLILYFSKVRIFLIYREKLEILLKLWFVKINVTKFMSSHNKKSKKPKLIRFDGEHFGEFLTKAEKEKKIKTTETANHKYSDSISTTASKKEPEKQNAKDVLDMIKEILSDISPAFKKCIDVKIHRLYVTAASKEAADTAIMFGHLNTAVGALILACKKFRNFEIDESCTGVYSDFVSEKPRIDTEIELVCHIRHITVSGIKGFMSYLKYKK